VLVVVGSSSSREWEVMCAYYVLRLAKFKKKHHHQPGRIVPDECLQYPCPPTCAAISINNDTSESQTYNNE